jgi:signal transduction histidine kinase
MSDLFATLVDFSSLKFDDETTSDGVAGNRVRILEMIGKIFPDATIQVWLIEENRRKNQLLLSYVYPKLDVRDKTDLAGIFFDVTYSNSPAEFLRVNKSQLEQAALDVLHRIGASGKSIYQFALSRVLSSNADTEYLQDKPKNVLGCVVISFPESKKLAEGERIILRLVRSQLAMLLEQSRVRRILDLSQECDQILRSSEVNGSKLGRAIDAIAQKCGAMSTVTYSVIGQTLTRESLGAKTDRLNDEDAAFAEWREAKFRIHPNCRRHIFEMGVGGARRQMNCISMPVALEGRRLSSHTFMPLGGLTDLSQRLDVVVLETFLLGKQSPYYLGSWFSQTDIEMTKVASHQIAEHMHHESFEAKYMKVTEFFDKLPTTGDLPYEVIAKAFSSNLPLAANFAILHKPAVGEKVNWLSNNSEPSDIPNGVLQQMDEWMESLRAYRGNGALEAISVCSQIDLSGNILLLHIPTKNVVDRFAFVRLKSDLVDQNSMKFVVFFIEELHMFLRSQDAIRERISMIAQVRHAVIEPLSGAKFYMETLQSEIDRTSRSFAAWEALKTDQEFHEFLDAAVTLTNQSLLIAQTGRYLLSEINHADLKIVHYNVVDLVNRIKKAFVGVLNERKLSFGLRVAGTYSGIMTGDEVLLWIAIANLFDNAVKYAHMRTEISIRLVLRDTSYRFEISDIGSFVPESDRKKIFQPFVRGRQYDNLNRRPGTGLGLPVSHMLLKAHSEQSDLDCRSTKDPQSGVATTVFFFELPYLIGQTGRPGDKATSPPGQAAK